MPDFEPLPKDAEELLCIFTEQAKEELLRVFVHNYCQELECLHERDYLKNYDVDFTISCSFQLTSKALSYDREKKEHRKQAAIDVVKSVSGVAGGIASQVSRGRRARTYEVPGQKPK